MKPVLDNFGKRRFLVLLYFHVFIMSEDKPGAIDCKFYVKKVTAVVFLCDFDKLFFYTYLWNIW